MFLQVLVFSALAILIGMVFNFVGYRFFRFLLPVWAFFVGMLAAMSAFDSLLQNGFLSTSMGLIVGFFFGLLLAAVAYFAYSFAVVIFGATVGFALGQGLFLVLGVDPGLLTWLAGVAMSVVFVLAFIKFRMPTLIIVVITTLAGSMAMIMGLFVLFGKLPPMMADLRTTSAMIEGSFLWVLLWLVLAGLGVATQYATEREVNYMKVVSMEEMVAETSVPDTKGKKPEDKK